MPSAKQILALLKSRANGDDEQFYSIALQIAASEARQGRRSTAEELRKAIDDARTGRIERDSVPVAISRPRGALEGLIDYQNPTIRMGDVIIQKESRHRIDDLIKQQLRRDWLREYGKVPNRRVLFVGPPGSGKTMTAEALAGSLRVPLYVIRLESLITRFMGETAAKLRLIFDEARTRRGVYLFDEFDALGGRRDASNDVAEMRRVLNSFLQFMEEPTSADSLIVGTTNHPDILDQALLRRFDLVLEFDLPNDDQIKAIIKDNLRPARLYRPSWKAIAQAARGLSQSEVVRATENAVKMAILDERDTVSWQDIVSELNERAKMQSVFLRKRRNPDSNG